MLLMQIHSYNAVFLSQCVLLLFEYQCRQGVCLSVDDIYSGFYRSHLSYTVISLWKGVKAVGLLGVGEGHSHARGERGVEDDCSALIARSQVHRGHRANALAVHDHILWPDAIPVWRRTQNI